MMANPEMPGTQEQGLAAVPPQGRPAEAPEAREAAGAAGAAGAEVPRPRSSDAPSDENAKPAKAPERREQERPARYEPDPERMPLLARVLLADVAVAVVALVVLFVIEVQRFGDASLSLRRRAWGEDLIVLFGVTVLFGIVAGLLAKAKHTRVAVVQTVVTVLVLAAAVTSAATGSPKASPDDPAPVSTTGNPG